MKVIDIARSFRAIVAYLNVNKHSRQRPGGAKPDHHPPQNSGHVAIFSSSIVYFVWTQATTKPLDLGRAVERLLEAEVATSAAWPSENRVRVSPSIAELDRGVSYLRFYRDLVSTESGWRGRLRLVIKNPRSAARAIIDKVKHLRFRAQRPPVTAGESDLSSFDSIMDELVETLIDEQKVSLVEREFDRRLFGGDAQEEDHYVRLLMRPLGITIRVASDEHEITIEPRLLLHRDGIIQLTFGIHLPDNSTTEDIISVSYPGNEYIESTKLPEAYVSAYGEDFEGAWEEGAPRGFRTRNINHSTSPAAPYNMLEIVIGSVIKTIRASEYGEWNCYPLIMASQGNCCRTWELYHAEDLRYLSIRAQPRTGERIDLDIGKDLSIRDNESHWANLASALTFYREPWEPHVSDLNRVMLHEHAMLTYTRLKRLERRIAQLPSRYKDVTDLYRTALQLSVETRGGSVRWGTARDALEHLLVALGAPQIRAAVDQGLAMLGERAALKVGEKQSKLANRLALVGLLVAAIAAAPVMPDMLKFIHDQRALTPSAGFWVILGGLFDSPLSFASFIVSAVLLYLTYVATRFLVRVFLYVSKSRKRGHLAEALGVEFVIGNADPDERDAAE